MKGNGNNLRYGREVSLSQNINYTFVVFVWQKSFKSISVPYYRK